MKFLFLLFFYFSSFSVEPFKVGEYVTDRAGILNSSQIAYLNEDLKSYEDQTSTQIVFIVVESLGGEVLEQVALDFADLNKIGRKGNDNGVLVFVAFKDKKIRIEVGYGLEGDITDLEAKQIIENIIAPSFREGSYFKGLSYAAEALKDSIESDFEFKSKAQVYGFLDFLPILFFVLIVLLSIKSLIPVFYIGVMGFSVLGGTAMAKEGAFGLAGVMVFYILGNLALRRMGYYKSLAARDGRSYRSGNHGGWGGGGFGGGGFSGGGGGFGGGGASGGW